MAAKTLSVTNVVVEMDEFLSRIGVKDRASVEKHLAACDAEADLGHSKLWRRLAGKLAALAPLPFRTGGPQALIFFVADGKYRMQLFALEDRRDGVITVYLPDILSKAVREKLLVKTGATYNVGRAKETAMSIDTMDAHNTPDPPPHIKHMIGWNRKAIRITLDATKPESPQVVAAESLCTLAAAQYSQAAP